MTPTVKGSKPGDYSAWNLDVSQSQW